MAVNRVDGIVDRLDLAVDRKLHRKLRRDPAVPCKIDQAATVTNFDLIDNFPDALHLPGHANGINAVLWFCDVTGQQNPAFVYLAGYVEKNIGVDFEPA